MLQVTDDILAGLQFNDNRRPTMLSPFGRLAFAVLIYAIHDGDMGWMDSENDSPFAYNTICENLKIDRHALRERIRVLRARGERVTLGHHQLLGFSRVASNVTQNRKRPRHDRRRTQAPL